MTPEQAGKQKFNPFDITKVSGFLKEVSSFGITFLVVFTYIIYFTRLKYNLYLTSRIIRLVGHHIKMPKTNDLWCD